MTQSDDRILRLIANQSGDDELDEDDEEDEGLLNEEEEEEEELELDSATEEE